MYGTSSSSTLWQWVENQLPGTESPGKRFAWCMVPRERCTSKICNTQPIFFMPAQAITKHARPDIYAHLFICGRLLSCRVILYQQNIYHKRIRSSRKLSDRRQGSRTEGLYQNMRYRPTRAAQVHGTMAHFQTLVISSPNCREYLLMYPQGLWAASLLQTWK